MNALKNRTQTIVEGEVVHGRQIGRTIGFPTANLLVSLENELYFQKGSMGLEFIMRIRIIMVS